MAKRLSDAERQRLIIETSESAAALSDDLKHFRRLLAQPDFSTGDARRLSAQLRRLLVDGDLRSVAAPRIVGKIYVQAPQLHRLHKADPSTLDIVSIADVQFAASKFSGFLMGRNIDGLFDPAERVPLHVQHFTEQKIIFHAGRWITRQNIIEYVANALSGIHSGKKSTDRSFEQIEKVRRRIRLKLRGNDTASVSIYTTDEKSESAKFEPGEFDLAHVHLMATAQLLVSDPAIINLERVIDNESQADIYDIG